MGDTQRKPSHQESQSKRGSGTEAVIDKSTGNKEEKWHISPHVSKELTCPSCGKTEDGCTKIRDAETSKCDNTHLSALNSEKCLPTNNEVEQNLPSTTIQKEANKENASDSNGMEADSTGRNPIPMADGNCKEKLLPSDHKEKPKEQRKPEAKPSEDRHACKYEAAMKNKNLAEENLQPGQGISKQGEDQQSRSRFQPGSLHHSNTRHMNKAEKIEKMLRERAPPNLPREWLNNIPQIAKQLEGMMGACEDDGSILQKLRELAVFVNSHPLRRKRKRHESTVIVQPRARLPQQIQQQRHWHNDKDEANSQHPKKLKPSGRQESSQSMGELSTVRQRVCLHQQQRLLLLRHASTCPFGDGRCPKTKHCGAMKRLWKHIVDCKNGECLVPHCVSSRYVLSHYYKCRDMGCNVCVPVRDAVRRGCDTLVPQERDNIKSKATADSESWPMISMGNTRVKITLGKKTSPGRCIQPHLKVSRSVANSEPELASSLVQTKDFGKGHKFLAQSEQHAKSVARAESTSAQTCQLAEKRTLREQQKRSKETLDSVNDHENLVESKEQGLDPNLMDWTEIDREVRIATLNNELQLNPFENTKCHEALKNLRSDSNCWLFDTPIDPIALNLVDYFKVISHPMDLGTVEKRLDLGLYQDMEEFKADVLLTFDNAMLYNEEGSKIHSIAKGLKDKFMMDYEKVIKKIDA
eukprot:CAMPEP_0185734664 /NCGR_PEP_ID=MMETSP1171-20130828/23163_1 /TAXON_ID=374046 /ORGANISM="Helicotheca tamensis, Strain CCMP826" /LENGTH=694 /DNA_ID=CAMNT_0028404725 /DNA_START=311 /DNA_END=2395 /DNA_ORIENTATION=+